ncbi:MAG: hypothetical protein VYB59_11720, partial [Pseudomonadota bacterium]|nr:hypothetical protein [Pseudomonadota bacterium]
PRFLDIHRGVLDQNIGADDIFDRIQHLGMMDIPICPLEQQIRLRALRKIEWLSGLGLKSLELGTESSNFRSVQNRNGTEKSVPAVALDSRIE